MTERYKMDALPRIPADFNDLGYDEPDVIPLGVAESFGLRNVVLRDGMAAIFYEAGELEAHGVLRRKRLGAGDCIWEAVIYPATIRHLDAAG